MHFLKGKKKKKNNVNFPHWVVFTRMKDHLLMQRCLNPRSFKQWIQSALPAEISCAIDSDSCHRCHSLKCEAVCEWLMSVMVGYCMGAWSHVTSLPPHALNSSLPRCPRLHRMNNWPDYGLRHTVQTDECDLTSWTGDRQTSSLHSENTTTEAYLFTL